MRAWSRRVSRHQAVVCAHGLFLNGWDMALLRHWLSCEGFTTFQFTYPTVTRNPVENARHLHDFVGQIEAPTIHFVAHSLGGLVLRHLFHAFPPQRPGRIVTLGTPHQGSSVALRLSRMAPAHLILGQSIEQGLYGDAPEWAGGRELGVIAGSLSIGLGRLITRLHEPNDGVVTVAETQLSNLKDHITLPVWHFGMLLSPTVAKQTAHFLKHGQFYRA